MKIDPRRDSPVSSAKLGLAWKAHMPRQVVSMTTAGLPSARKNRSLLDAAAACDLRSWARGASHHQRGLDQPRPQGAFERRPRPSKCSARYPARGCWSAAPRARRAA